MKTRYQLCWTIAMLWFTWSVQFSTHSITRKSFKISNSTKKSSRHRNASSTRSNKCKSLIQCMRWMIYVKHLRRQEKSSSMSRRQSKRTVLRRRIEIHAKSLPQSLTKSARRKISVEDSSSCQQKLRSSEMLAPKQESTSRWSEKQSPSYSKSAAN